jgi:beta-glucanase (GH16 family)
VQLRESGVKRLALLLAILAGVLVPISDASAASGSFTDNCTRSALTSNLAAQSGFSRPGNSEAEWYETPAVTVGGGYCDITAQSFASLSQPDVVSSWGGTPQPVDYPYRSGEIHSTKNFLYGTFSIRAKVPVGAGTWPAFWLVSNNDSTYLPEIDIDEWLGADPTYSFETYHWSWSPYLESGTNTNTGVNLSSAFHTYTLVWEPSGMTWEIDGHVVKSISAAQAKALDTSIPSVPLMLILNLAVGSAQSWGGAPNAATVFPATYQIDWVKVST